MTRQKDTLTPDEEDLWHHVVERVRPLHRPRHRQTAVGETVAKQQGEERIPAPDTAPSPTAPPLPRRWQPLVTNPPPRPQATSNNDGFDRKRRKRIAAGQIEIEGRIDLHGLRESEAHMRLRGFLRKAQTQGKRTVLVITGKGRDADDPYAPFDISADRAPRGILKRNVPRWLAEPDLAGIVVSYATAHVRHGGEGALYVHLRRA